MRIESNMAHMWVDGQLVVSSQGEQVESGIMDYAFEGPVVYEVIRIMQGQPLFLKEHLNRMGVSLSAMEGLRNDEKSPKWQLLENQLREAIQRVISSNAIQDNNLKLLIGNQGGSVLVYPIASYYPPKEVYALGVDTELVCEVRVNPQVKVVNEDLTTKISRLRQEKGIFEALLCDAEGEIAEGSRSNVFFVRNQTLLTPPAKAVLMGITREKVIEAASRAGIKVLETIILEEDLGHMEAAFLTGTSLHILPIKRIGDLELSSSEHPLVHKLMESFEHLLQQQRQV